MSAEPADELIDVRPQQLRPKIGFLVHTPDLFHHFGPVINLLNPDEAEIILHTRSSHPELEAAAAQWPHACYHLGELITEGIGYQLLVSNHLHGLADVEMDLAGADRKQGKGYLIRMLGEKNVRFMYGFGADSWNLDAWNSLYDAFLCHGPLQVKQLAPFAGRKLQMGYPRYDRFFYEPFERQHWLEYFGCNPDKPVLVWLSTLQSYHGVLDLYARELSQLSQDYNLIVKPHPMSWDNETDYVSELEGLPFQAVVREALDNLILFQLADWVLCDYGGTAFSALYTDCPLILLDHPDYQGQAGEDPLSSDTDQWLRRYIIHLGPGQAAQIPELLASRRLWQAQKPVRAWLRQQLFSTNYGYSAQTAAQLLKMLRDQPL